MQLNCSDGICDLDGQALSESYVRLANADTNQLHEILRNTNQTIAMRASALRHLSSTRDSVEMLGYSRLLFKDADLKMRRFAFITLYFWLLNHDVVSISNDSIQTIQAAHQSDGTVLEPWPRLIRALLCDPLVLDESRAMIASGESGSALKLLALMRTDSAIDIIKKEIWRKGECLATRINASLVLAANGDVTTEDDLRAAANPQSTEHFSDRIRIRAIIALARLGDETAMEKLQNLLRSESLSEGDGYLLYVLRGWGYQYADFETRVSNWLLQFRRT